MGNPEQQARQGIDRLLATAGWAVQSVDSVKLYAAHSVAIREFPLEPGHGFADYLLYVGGTACLPASPPAWHWPLPFLYESTGNETHFTQGERPGPRP